MFAPPRDSLSIRSIDAAPALEKALEQPAPSHVEFDAARQVARIACDARSRAEVTEALLLLSASPTSSRLRLLILQIRGSDVVENEGQSPLCRTNAPSFTPLTSHICVHRRAAAVPMMTPPPGSRLSRAMATLLRKGVIVVCTVEGHVTGDALFVCSRAHYRIFASSATAAYHPGDSVARRALHAALSVRDAEVLLQHASFDADRAFEAGFANEVHADASSLQEHASRFATWIVHHNEVAIGQCLRLGFPSDFSADVSSATSMPDWKALLQSELHSPHVLMVSSEGEGTPTNDEAGIESKLALQVKATAMRLALREHSDEAQLDSKHARLLAPLGLGCDDLNSCLGESPTRSMRELPLRQNAALRAFEARQVGIHAMEIYTPRHCISAAELETAHDVEGKYTRGLMMEAYAACDEDEDVVSMGMTVVYTLDRSARPEPRGDRHAGCRQRVAARSQQEHQEPSHGAV